MAAQGQQFRPIPTTAFHPLSVLTEASLSPRNTPLPPDLLSSASESDTHGSDTSSPSVKRPYVFNPSPLSTPASHAIPLSTQPPQTPVQPQPKRRASMGKWTIVEDDLLRQVRVLLHPRRSRVVGLIIPAKAGRPAAGGEKSFTLA